MARIGPLVVLLAGLAAAAVLLYYRLAPALGSKLGERIRAYDLPSAALYDRLTGRLMAGAYEAMARELANRLPSGRVLDVGAGPGHLASRLAELNPGVEVMGVDLMPEMVERATERAVRRHLLPRLQFRQGDVSELPFPDESFDLVTSSFSLHHWADPVRGLYEIRRVLRPGGVAVIFDLPAWLLATLAHGVDLPELAAEKLFAQVDEGRLRWPLGLPVVRRLVLVR